MPILIESPAQIWVVALEDQSQQCVPRYAVLGESRPVANVAKLDSIISAL